MKASHYPNLLKQKKGRFSIYFSEKENTGPILFLPFQ